MQVVDTGNLPGSNGEEIGEERRSSADDTAIRRNLTMDGHSGHPVWKKFLYDGWWIGYVLVAYFCIGTGNFFTSTLRVSGQIVGPYQIALRVFNFCWQPLMGYVVDAEYGMGLFEKVGITRKKYGRRVPYFLVTNALVLILGFFTWRPSKWADIALKQESDATLYGVEFAEYQWKGKDVETYPTGGLIDPKKGLACDKPIKLWSTSRRKEMVDGSNFTLYNFNATRSGGRVPIYAQQFCEAMISKGAVCWPGK